MNNEIDGVRTHKEDDATKDWHLENDNPMEGVELDKEALEALKFYPSLRKRLQNMAGVGPFRSGYNQAKVTLDTDVHDKTIPKTYADALKTVKSHKWLKGDEV